MLAPHHGGRTSNPAWLYDWAKPALVVVSQRSPAAGSRDPLTPLAEGHFPLLRSWQSGAIRLRWSPSALLATGFLDAEPSIPAMPTSIGSKALATLLGLTLGAALCLALTVVEWGAWSLVMPGRRLLKTSPDAPPGHPIQTKALDGTRLAGELVPERSSRRPDDPAPPRPGRRPRRAPGPGPSPAPHGVECRRARRPRLGREQRPPSLVRSPGVRRSPGLDRHVNNSIRPCSHLRRLGPLDGSRDRLEGRRVRPSDQGPDPRSPLSRPQTRRRRRPPPPPNPHPRPSSPSWSSSEPDPWPEFPSTPLGRLNPPHRSTQGS